MIGESNFYSEKELREAGFKGIGENVKISRKASLYKIELMEIGDNVRIEDFCILNGRVMIGSNVTICAYCLLDGYAGITLEEDVTLAAKVSIHSGSDDYSGRSLFGTYIPSRYRKYHYKGSVLIKSHSLIGDSSIILPGLTLETGTAVGANSFLRNSTTPWGIYAGSPAKRIRERSDELLRHYDLFKNKEWTELDRLIENRKERQVFSKIDNCIVK